MSNDVLILDFETFYSQDYSLRKMTPAQYILDPRYETILCAAQVNFGDHFIVDGPDFAKFISGFKPETTTTVTFNALFDNAILSWVYGFVPDTMLDAMAMARALMGHELVRFNLASIADHLNLGRKGDAINNVIGMTRATIKSNPDLWASYQEYSLQDNRLCEGVFKHLYPRMPWSERRLMDLVLRCCVEPRFQVDTELLRAHIADVVAAKEQLIVDAGSVDKSVIMSTAKFKAALEALGVEVELKDSPTAKDADGNPKQTPAFSKTDEFMASLIDSDDPAVAALAAARIGLKSTLEETRSKTLMAIGELNWKKVYSFAAYRPMLRQIAQEEMARAFDPNYRPGKLFSLMPIPLRYGGAHTHRLSGDWKMNMQNMPTVRGSKGKSKLRLSLKAPPGHTVVTCDLGQIEARLVGWICGCTALMEEFGKKLDPYNKLAGDIFGRPVNRKLTGTVDEIMGFIGKTGILGLGYGCGKDNFDTMVVRSARAQQVDISQIYTRAIGDKGVDAYRKRYFQIPAGWNRLNQIVATQWSTQHMPPVHFGPVTISFGKILLPSGMTMEYAEPQSHNIKTTDKNGREQWRQEFKYRYGKFWHRMYGAKMLENIVQALARIIVMNAALRIRDRGKLRPHPEAYRFVLQAHDELVFIVPNSELDFAKQLIHSEMVRPPSWGKDIPLTADIGTGQSYGEAK
jgi:DNA polymerase